MPRHRPAHQPGRPPDPTAGPRYYDTRSTRRAFLAGAGAAAVVAGAGGWFLWKDIGGGSSAPAATDPGALGNSPLPVGTPAPIGTDPSLTVLGAPADRQQERSAATAVAMVGDSLTQGSRDALVYTLTAQGFTSISIDGVKSRRIAVGNGKSEPLAGIDTMYGMMLKKTKADVWVVALGTNDVGQYSNPDDYGQLIDRVVQMLPTSMPLVWVDVYRPQYLNDTKLFNNLLTDKLGSRPRTAVADWYGFASAPKQKILNSDHLHPNPVGQTVFALIVANAVATVTKV